MVYIFGVFSCVRGAFSILTINQCVNIFNGELTNISTSFLCSRNKYVEVEAI